MVLASVVRAFYERKKYSSQIFFKRLKKNMVLKMFVCLIDVCLSVQHQHNSIVLQISILIGKQVPKGRLGKGAERGAGEENRTERWGKKTVEGKGKRLSGAERGEVRKSKMRH